MPMYTYRCPGCGPFDVVAPMTRSRDERSCPTCASPADRVFSPPGLRQVDPSLRRARDAEERSRHEPTVTTSVPPSSKPAPVSRDPRHARLPRP